MAIPTNRQQLIDYCLRKLGSPVINIEVADEQLDDRVDEAIEVYQEKHYDATEFKWVSYVLTENDINNGYITLPEHVHTVTEVAKTSGLFNNSGLFSYQYQIALNTLSPWQPFDSTDYFMKMTDYYNTVSLTDPDTRFVFSKHGRKLIIYENDLQAGLHIGIKIFQLIDPEEVADVYNDKWLKQYLVALIKRQWGENLKKFDNVQMLGSVELNGQQIFDEALAEIERLEEELEQVYSDPTDFFIG